MNFGKLKRVAIKEFKRSPAKTVFLLAMLPVALYFCVPLLVGAAKKSSPSTSAATAGAVPNQADFVLPAATSAVVTPSQVGPSWVEVARSLDSDLLALPVGIPTNARNPFAASKLNQIVKPLVAAEEGESGSRAETESAPVESVDPTVLASDPIQALGLRLTATMVGQRSRLATINGKTYEEGESFSMFINAGEAAGGVKAEPLELAQVERRFVVLKIGGHEHRLQLPNEIQEGAIGVKPRPE